MTVPAVTEELLGPHLTRTARCSSSLQFLLEDEKKSAGEIHLPKAL